MQHCPPRQHHHDSPSRLLAFSPSRLIAAFAAAACLTSATASAQIYVNAAVGTSGNGMTWGQAYKTLEEALTDASGQQIADRDIRVAIGTYRVPEGPVGAERTGTFFVPEGTKLRGGFLPGESLATWSRAYRSTILDGDSQGDGLRTNNMYTVVTLEESVTDETWIEGFVIQNGEATDSSGSVVATEPGVDGGGIYAVGAILRLQNCYVAFNRAKRSGGGLYFNGGEGDLIGERTIRIYRTYFQFNIADRTGGGASIVNPAANFGLAADGPSWMYNATFERNLAGEQNVDASVLGTRGGGGLFLGRDYTRDFPLTLGAIEGVPGSGVDLELSMLIANSRFFRNSCHGLGAALRIDDRGDGYYISTSTFAYNQTNRVPSGFSNAEGRTIWADGGQGFDGAVDTLITSSIVYFGLDPTSAVNAFDAIGGQGATNPAGTPSLTIVDSNVFTAGPGVHPGGISDYVNLDVDPDFVSVAMNDFQLDASSPLIDTAREGWRTPDYPDMDGDSDRAEPIPLDWAVIAGQSRVTDFTAPASFDDLDMGARERF